MFVKTMSNKEKKFECMHCGLEGSFPFIAQHEGNCTGKLAKNVDISPSLLEMIQKLEKRVKTLEIAMMEINNNKQNNQFEETDKVEEEKSSKHNYKGQGRVAQ